ncbi:hypothetical protein [Tersicoccus sp. Bi-70]|uniref:hypothetical protein n=1 Tax=Tersicoccus sp. Bi-70 TaxID=1897634 RepID=UPI00117FA65F|nr:hypothetical protein [Tersicoccus sp. Bi-70]
MSGLDVGPDTLAALRALKRAIERETTSARVSDTPAPSPGPLTAGSAPRSIAHYAAVNGVDEQFLIAAFAAQGTTLEPGGMIPPHLVTSTRAYIERRFRTIMRENRNTSLLQTEAPSEAPVPARHGDEVTTERLRAPSTSRATWLAPITPAVTRQRPRSTPTPRASQAERSRVAQPTSQRRPLGSPQGSESRSWLDDDIAPGRRLILERDLQVAEAAAPARSHRTAPLPGEDDGPHALLARELREDLTPVRFARFADSLATALLASMNHERLTSRSSGRAPRTA